MFMKIAIVCVVAFGAFTVLRLNAAEQERKAGGMGGRYFEMRTYHANPGKMDALNKRFREHTNALFKKHGMTIVGFWQPVTKPDQLIYLLAYKDGAARDAAWAAFGADPEWVKVRTEMAVNVQVDNVFMSATDYGPLK